MNVTNVHFVSLHGACWDLVLNQLMLLYPERLSEYVKGFIIIYIK